MQLSGTVVGALAVLLAAAAAGCAAAPAQPMPTCTPVLPPTSLSFDELQARLAPAWNQTVADAEAFLAKQNGASSMVMSFNMAGRTMFRAMLGVTNTSEPGSAPSPDTIYRLGSVTKIFPAMLAVVADERGLLPHGVGRTTFRDLDARFGITDVNGNAGTAGPPIESVMYQLGGLPREAPFQYNQNPGTGAALAAINESLWMLAEPYTLLSYSNLGFALLGHLVSEGALGANFSEALRSEFAAPLNLSTLGLTYPPDIVARMPVPYQSRGVPGKLLDLGWIGPAGQARISLRDMDTLQLALLAALGGDGAGGRGDSDAAGRLPLSPGGVRRLFGTWRANGPGGTGIGSPWEMLRIGNDWIFAKGGNTAFFSAATSFATDLGVGANVFWNGAVSEFNFLEAFWGVMVPAVRETLSAAPLYAPPPATAAPYVGTYASGPTAFSVKVVNGTLSMVLGGATLPLSHVTGERFRMRMPIPVVAACFNWELEAIDLSYAVFQRKAGGNATGVIINELSLGSPIPRIA